MKAVEDKLQEPFSFRKHGDFDVARIKEIALSFTDEDWKSDTTRQQSYDLLRNTESYFIYQTKQDWVSSEPFVSDRRTSNDELHDLIDYIVCFLEEQHEGTRGKVLLTRLPAGKDIPKHQDAGDYLYLVRRHHIAINTDESITFTVGKEVVHMQEGECWEINNSRLHSVNNGSDVTRIHLIIDIMPNKALV